MGTTGFFLIRFEGLLLRILRLVELIFADGRGIVSFIVAVLRLGLFLLGNLFFFLAHAVLFYQLIERFEVTEDMDAAPSVQVRGLEQPQVE